MTNIELETMAAIKAAARKYTGIGYWEALKHQAAIAVMPQCIQTTYDVLARGGAIVEETMCKQVAKNSIEYAEALIEELKSQQ